MTDHRAPTIADVADRAGVSRQTVSRVINHDAYVANPTRAKVLEAIRDLGYHPNVAAQALGRRNRPGPRVPARDADA